MSDDPSPVAGESSLRELYPIKLVGGFITVDQHVGCVGCRWCLSRRHGLWRDVFSRDTHLQRGAFEDAEEAYALLDRSIAFTRARVPLRFGHNTDASLQWDFGEALYRLTPPSNPFIFMTRYPVTPPRAELFRGQRNLLCKLSVPPRSELLGSLVDPHIHLRSVAGLPRENLFVLIGPVAADGVDGARELMRALPPGTWADVKPLTRWGIDTVSSTPLPDPAVIDDIRREGRSRGLMVTDYFGCQFRRRLGRAFYKALDSPAYAKATCDRCEGRPRCFGPRAEGVAQAIRGEAARIGLTLGVATSTGPATTRFLCAEPSSRGDETYLSELFDHQVLLSSVPDGSQGGSFSLEDADVTERWERVGMLPSTEIRRLAQRLQRRLLDQARSS